MIQLQTLKLIAVALLIAWGMLATWAWRHEANAAIAFKAAIVAEGRTAEAVAKKVETAQKQTAKEISDAWDQSLPSIQARAVAAYAARHPVRVCNASSSQVPVAAPSAEGAHAPVSQPLVAGEPTFCQPDAEFIRACASDALTVDLWVEWARKNNLPVQ